MGIIKIKPTMKQSANSPKIRFFLNVLEITKFGFTNVKKTYSAKFFFKEIKKKFIVHFSRDFTERQQPQIKLILKKFRNPVNRFPFPVLRA